MADITLPGSVLCRSEACELQGDALPCHDSDPEKPCGLGLAAFLFLLGSGIM
jgi:hypothetical protein